MSFPKFSSLPAEIRCAIWEYAVQMTAPRIVYLKHCALPLNEHVFSRVRSNWAVGDPAPADCALIMPKQTLCAFIGEQQLAEMETAVFGNGVSVRDFVGNQGIEPIAVTERGAEAASNAVTLSSGTARVQFAGFKTRWPAARAEDPGADNDLPGWTPPFSSHLMEDGRVRIEWQDDPCQGPLPLKGFKSTSTIPPILVVCRESFEIASKTYRPAFATLGILPENYIDFNRDTVYFNHESIEDTPVDRHKLQLLNCDYNELRQIKRLAIEPPTHTIQFHLVEGWLAGILSVLGNVTHVSLVAEPMVLSGESMTSVVKEFHGALHNRNRIFVSYKIWLISMNTSPEEEMIPSTGFFLRLLIHFKFRQAGSKDVRRGGPGTWIAFEIKLRPHVIRAGKSLEYTSGSCARQLSWIS
ncbi:hypothetical protein B0J14DRAFT_351715 [Halenospora varia]|nr:hypothetical protein B0J14DRAFT_351715 [Halenospora varia]